jgi:hypothetical protein
MKRLLGTILASSALFAGSAAALFAQALCFDEYGRGYEIVGNPDFSTTTNPLSYMVEPDPSSYLEPGPNVLVYYLPNDCLPVIDGDVALVDPNSGGAVSHLIRFLNSEGAVVFYAKDGTHSLADKGYIPASPNAVQINWQGQSATGWKPISGQPGFCSRVRPMWEIYSGYTIYSQLPVPASGANGPLTITRVSPNLLLSWPTNLPGCSLYQNPDLAGTNWVAVTNTVGVANGQNKVLIPGPLSGAGFFRLQVP